MQPKMAPSSLCVSPCMPGQERLLDVVDDLAVQVPDLNADGQAVVRALGVVGVLGGHNDVVG